MDDVKWLMAREIPRLRRYARILADSSDAADDLVQDCLERAIRKRHLWSRRGSMRSWLYRILYNVFLNQSVERGRRRIMVPLDDEAVPLASPATQEDKVICTDIAQALQRLPKEQRAAIALIAVEGLSYDEAASILDIPIGTLRSRLSRGRDHLRSVFAVRKESVTLRQVM